MNRGNKKRKKKCQQITGGLAKLGGEVIARISARPLTGGDSPNCVQLPPNFVKPPPRYVQCWKRIGIKLLSKKR